MNLISIAACESSYITLLEIETMCLLNTAVCENSSISNDNYSLDYNFAI